MQGDGPGWIVTVRAKDAGRWYRVEGGWQRVRADCLGADDGPGWIVMVRTKGAGRWNRVEGGW